MALVSFPQLHSQLSGNPTGGSTSLLGVAIAADEIRPGDGRRASVGRRDRVSRCRRRPGRCRYDDVRRVSRAHPPAPRRPRESLNLRTHRLAVAEIDHVDYYESCSAGLGTELEEEIDAVLETILQFPHAAPKWRDRPDRRVAVLDPSRLLSSTKSRG